MENIKIGTLSLGVDMGTNSIGWTLISHDRYRRPVSLVESGVRIFREAVDVKTRVPKNQTRRAARAARKLCKRRKMRLTSVMNLLLGRGLLPETILERELLFSDTRLFDPYALRKRALDEKLEAYELGRVLYHLARRRGFQSNRKAASKDDSTVKSAITVLRQEMADTGNRTLGEYLAGQPRKRNRYTDRLMYEEEFDHICSEQHKYHPDILDAPFKVALRKAIFFQRPLRLQKNLIGKCTFEPSRRRAARALLEAQRFRILQDINHLEVRNPATREFRPLIEEERKKLYEVLEKQKSLSWSKARKLLGLHEGEVFNLEEGKKKELIGNRTACTMRSIIGSSWDELGQIGQEGSCNGHAHH